MPLFFFFPPVHLKAAVLSLHSRVSALATEENQSNLQAKAKLPTASLEEEKKKKKYAPPSMTNKSIEIHETWLAVLTARHTRRLEDWPCAAGQRGDGGGGGGVQYFIEM